MRSKKGRFMQFGRIAGAATLAVAFGLGTMAVAQDAPPVQQPPAAAAQDFSEDQLDAFVAAALEVSGIQQQAAERLQATEGETAQQSLLQEANQQMIAVIEAEPGISVPEYVAIAQAAEVDPTLRERIEAIMVARLEQPAQ
jgi:hypothetical protein